METKNKYNTFWPLFGAAYASPNINEGNVIQICKHHRLFILYLDSNIEI